MTGAFYLLPILLWRSSSGRWGFQHASVWVLVGMVGIVGLGWNAYADGVRASQPATEFLATRNQYGWLFGSVAQRLDVASWRVPLVAILTLTGSGAVVWALLAARAMREHPQRLFLGAILLLIAVLPLIFFNLYAIHDYYWAAVAPLIALSIGLGAHWLWGRVPARWARLTVVGLAGAWVATLIGTAGTWSLIYAEPAELDRTLRVANFIRSNSEPGDWVVIEGFGWNSAFLYYAERRGFTDPTGDNLLDPGDIDVEAILDDPIYGPYFRCEAQGDCMVSETR